MKWKYRGRGDSIFGYEVGMGLERGGSWKKVRGLSVLGKGRRGV